MTRLTVLIKNKMVNKALDVAGINKDLKALIGRRGLLANSIRLDCLGGIDKITEIEKHFQKVKKLTQSNLIKNVSSYSAFYAQSDFELNHINLGGMRVTLQYSGEVCGYNDKEKRVTHGIVPNDSSVGYNAEHEFTKEFLLIEGDYKAILGKKDGIAAQVKATLNQFTTVKRLLEAWPESKDLIPDNVDEVKSKLPVVMVQDLNCLIGLPE